MSTLNAFNLLSLNNHATNMMNRDINCHFNKIEENFPQLERLSESSSSTTSSLSSTKSPRKSLKKGMKPLPEDFEVSNYSVLCGRGKGCYNAIGNRRLRVIVSTFLQQYVDAQNSPHEKARIIEKVVSIVKQACPVGAFIKYEDGSYFELSDKACKEKVSALFRDFLISSYKEEESNSKESKRKQRTSLALTAAPPINLPPKQTCQLPPVSLPQGPQTSLHQLQMQSFYQSQQQQHHHQQRDQQFPMFGQAADSLQRDTSLGSNESTSNGAFYDVDTRRSVSIKGFDDERGFFGIRHK